MLPALLLLTLSQRAPDVVVFVVDDVAAADLALYGGPVACPNLEGLARQGITFTRCYSNPTCAPTRRAIMTGHWWVRGNGEPCLPPQPNTPKLDEVFLPEVLPGHVSGLFGKWHVGANPFGGAWERAPIAHGFDFWLAGLAANASECGGTGLSNWLEVVAEPGWHRAAFSSDYQPLRERLMFLSAWNALPSPRLALVASNLAHAPFHEPPPIALPPGYRPQPTPRGLYEAMITSWDFLLGRMLAGLDLNRTLVVVVGDNGTPPPVAPEPGRAKGTTFERGVRVPLVVAGGPTVSAGRVEDELVHVVDLLATLAWAGGGTVPQGSPYPVVSRSWKPILMDQAHAPLHDMVLVGAGWGRREGEVAAVSRAGLKLRWVDLDGDERADSEQLFDLVLDPGESVNRSADLRYGLELGAMRAFLRANVF
jgi:arylsulfatase